MPAKREYRQLSESDSCRELVRESSRQRGDPRLPDNGFAHQDTQVDSDAITPVHAIIRQNKVSL